MGLILCLVSGFLWLLFGGWVFLAFFVVLSLGGGCYDAARDLRRCGYD